MRAVGDWTDADWEGLEDVLTALGGEEAGPAEDARRRQLREGLVEAVRRRALQPLVEAFERQVEELAGEGAGYEEIARRLLEGLEPLQRRLLAAYGADPARTRRALEALARLRTELLVALGRVYARLREAAVAAHHAQAIRALSTPVIPIWDQVLVLPVIGVLDAARARQLMEHLLEQIVARQARFVIVDVTGVAHVDTQVANHLLTATRAARLVGARSILVGIRPQVGQTLVRLGVSFGELETELDLRSGLERALRHLGYVVVPAGGAAPATGEGGR